MGQIINKTIKIESIAIKDGRYSIKDSEGKSFSFFQFKNGTKETTQAYEQLNNGNHNGPFVKGDYAFIGYSENASVARDGQPITYRNIVSIMPAQGGQAEPRAEAPSPSNPGGDREPEMESRKDFGRRLAIHGMVNGLLASGEAPARVAGMLQELIKLEEAIDAELNGNSQKSDGSNYPDGDKIPF